MSYKTAISDQEEKQNKNRKVSGIAVKAFGGFLRSWADVSKLNFLSACPGDVFKSAQTLRRKSMGFRRSECAGPTLLTSHEFSSQESFGEEFPVNITSLMNEDRLWGCFYVLPELYSDAYSPTVKVRCKNDVPELVGGVLTKDVVAVSVSFLARTPILGDYVYIKLNLSAMLLQNIDVLMHYKYLVYLDLSSNFLTELRVLSHLPYLQYLSVSFNRLNTVLEYDTPQWFLTEVLYKYNSVKKIGNLNEFWSITILDLSHNNIKHITGLETLRYLRHLDLSFNHIQKLENLNHLQLLWLDISYNNISNFEFDSQSGLWTLFNLEYLNLNENNLMSMKIFAGCTRIRELRARNNRLGTLLELAVYMRQLRSLVILDLRANPMCSINGYKEVVINTFPNLLSLDEMDLDPVEQRRYRMDMSPDIDTFSIRRLLRLMYVEQLDRARVSPCVPPADTTEVPIVVLVGYEAVGKGTLARRLAHECSSHVERALLHTTADHHHAIDYHHLSREKFDAMLLAGELLTYSEINGESYGLSREEAFVKDGKVRVACMDLLGALMIKHRGRRPYLILATFNDKLKLAQRQNERLRARVQANNKRISIETPMERSTLQMLLSGRIIITGIINEIIMNLVDVKDHSEFQIASECSLLMDSEVRQAAQDYAKGVHLLTLLDSHSSLTSEEASKHIDNSPIDNSLFSLYKESQVTDEYNSDISGQNNSLQVKKKAGDSTAVKRTTNEKGSNISRTKSVDFSRYTSSTWKGLSGAYDSAKSSKCVAFNSRESSMKKPDSQHDSATTDDEGTCKGKDFKSISRRLPFPNQKRFVRTGSGHSMDDDLWLRFLMDAGVLHASEMFNESSITPRNVKGEDCSHLMKQVEFYQKSSATETITPNIRSDYENIHLLCPGLFWDTVTMDDEEKAFKKMKLILNNIVNSQPLLSPMFDIDVTDYEDHPNYQERLMNITNKIAPHRLFY